MSEVKCETCEANDRDRSNWGPGPWESEPNRVEFEHAGLPCIVHRGGAGGWCGYVGLSPSHPLHGASYNDCGHTVEVHGGLTYSEHCQDHICHVPKPGECDDLFWLGFDCGHAYDKVPGRFNSFATMFGDLGGGEHYWTMEECRAETCNLADQLAAMKTNTL